MTNTVYLERGDWDMPPEDGPCKCPDCNGKGLTNEVVDRVEYTDGTVENEYAACACCEGMGWLTADGEPCEKPRWW